MLIITQFVLFSGFLLAVFQAATLNSKDFTAALGCSDLDLKCTFGLNSSETPLELTWKDKSGKLIYTMNFEKRSVSFESPFSFGISNDDNFTKGDITFPKSNVNKAMAGEYVCELRTDETRVTAKSTVVIQYGPTTPTVRKLSPPTIQEGSTVTLRCDATSNPTPSKYRWTGPGGVTGSSKDIKIPNIKRSQSGAYRCTATTVLKPTRGSSCSKTSTASITISVYYNDPPTLTINNLHPRENTPLVITCQTKSNPSAVVSISPGISGATNSRTTNKITYTLQKATCRHSGSYRCQSRNTRISNTKYSVTKTINILCKPRFKSSPSTLPLTLRMYQVAQFSVDVWAYPSPKFSWFQRGEHGLLPVKSNAAVTSTGLSTKIRFNITSPEHYGVYVVEANNSQGQAEIRNFTLLSDVKPFEIEEVRVLNTSSNSIFMQWLSPFDGGNPQTFYFEFASERDHNQSIWSTRHEIISDPGRYQNVTGGIFNLQAGRTYYIRIISNNSRGNRISVTVTAKTDPPGDLNGSTATGIGIGIGICILIAALVLLAWLVYHLKIKPLRNKGNHSDKQGNVNMSTIEDTNESEQEQNTEVTTEIKGQADPNYDWLRKHRTGNETYDRIALKPNPKLGPVFKSSKEEDNNATVYQNYSPNLTQDKVLDKATRKKATKKKHESNYANVKPAEAAESPYMNMCQEKL